LFRDMVACWTYAEIDLPDEFGVLRDFCRSFVLQGSVGRGELWVLGYF